ncbi:transglutaminase-like domain-containing protein [Anaeromassilibacillus senegalensis]|uniref:transglutaminase-like domain-containing protein n=1 Tax=Anaeromassilibacillus senegalensis TaxID=1673717 RepID=UPI0006809984|nr:transglutaminase-like domain-containing protein [Anaeromassilibacillus senegalensis]
MNRAGKKIGLVLMALLLLFGAGCASGPAEATESDAYIASVDLGIEDIEEEAVALAKAPAIPNNTMPKASGSLVKKSEKAEIDYSNTADGYVMARYAAASSKKLKAQVKGPSGTAYTYNLTAGADYATFPLSDGNGSYKVTVFENISGTSYATVVSVTFTAALKDEFAPFLLPNQYVNYTPDSQVVKKAAELTGSENDPLKKVQTIYDYVVKNITYDDQKAASVQSGYLPVLDTVLSEKKGICFDYAAVMAAMLRSQNVPTKLVVGYSGSIYHAWINVYSKETGWVEGVVYFDGTSWKLMDPTFASSGKQSKKIMEYIGNDANYSAKYIY